MSEMKGLLETIRIPEPQRTWIIELLGDLVRQRNECMDRNLVRLQTDMGTCQFIPKAQADEEIAKLRCQANLEEMEMSSRGLEYSLRIGAALSMAEQSKDAVVVLAEVVYALRGADKDELMEWKRERAKL